MIDNIEISPKLEEWGSLAGYTLTAGARAHDGRPLFWSAGGEVRTYVDLNVNGWFVITDSDRFGPEFFVLAAPAMATIEKYLYGRFGRSIRSRRSLPRVHIPTTREELSAGYSLGTQMFEGVQRLALINAAGDTVAIASSDEVTGTGDLAKLSLYLTVTVDDITAAFLDPKGKPLFAPR